MLIMGYAFFELGSFSRFYVFRKATKGHEGVGRFKVKGFRAGVAPIVSARRSLVPTKNDDIYFFITRDFNSAWKKENGTIPF